MLESKEGSITGGEDRLMLSSFPTTLLKNNILEPELKDTMHVKFDFNQPMDFDQD
jgi:hypothetical protein